MIKENGMNKNIDTWWGQDATRILDYIEMYRGNMSDFEVLEDIMCGSYVDEFADHSKCDPKVCDLKDEFDITGRDIINMILPSEEEE